RWGGMAACERQSGWGISGDAADVGGHARGQAGVLWGGCGGVYGAAARRPLRQRSSVRAASVAPGGRAATAGLPPDGAVREDDAMSARMTARKQPSKQAAKPSMKPSPKPSPKPSRPSP